MIYHISPQKGLKVLKPHISTHKKPYVYAIENMVTGMLFGVKKDDFDFLLFHNENNIPTIYECYPDAFQKKYRNASCSVYILKETGFQRGITSWEPELVSENEVSVVEEIAIDDLYQRLLQEEQNNNLIIHRYEFTDEYRKTIANHIVNRIILFDLDLETLLKQDIRFSTYYKDISRSLLEVLDGHLLQ